MDILINVAGQKMNVATVPSTLVEGTQNFIRFVFRLSDDWNGLNPLVQFTQGDKTYNKYLDSVNKSVYLPNDYVSGKFTMVLFGAIGSIQAVSNILEFKLEKSGFLDGEFQEIIPEPTWYQQLMTRIQNVIDMSDEEVMNVISNSVHNIMEEYMTTDEWRQQVISIEDNSISASKFASGALVKNKMEQSVQASLDNADTAMQPSVYDTNNKAEDIFDYADTKSSEAITSAVSSVRNVQSFDLPNAGGITTNYTGLDEALLGIVGTAKSYADIKANGTTQIVTTLPTGDDIDTTKNYILNSNGKYMMYRYIGDAWELIAGGAAEVFIYDSNVRYFEDDSPSNKGIEANTTGSYIDYSAMKIYTPNVEVEYDPSTDTEDTTYSWQLDQTLVSSPDEMTDYYLYLSQSGELYHLRYFTDTFVIVNKSESTMVVNSLPTYPKEEVDYILNDNGDYKYYKYINNNWVLISGGSAVVLGENPNVSGGYNKYIYGNGSPSSDLANEENFNKKLLYLDIQTMQQYLMLKLAGGYVWAAETILIPNPNTSKDYYIQDENEMWGHFRYIGENFVQIGSSSYTRDQVDSLVAGVSDSLSQDISDIASDVSALTSQMSNISNMVKDVTISQDKTTLTITYMNNDTTTIELDTGIDIDTTRYNVDDDHKLHFYDSQGNELEGLAVEITGAGGGGAATSGSVTIGRITAASIQTIFGTDCEIGFTVAAVDASNEQVGDGVGTLYVNNIAVASGFSVSTSVLGAENSVNVGNYLSVGTNTIKISVSVDTGGETNTVTTKTWSVNAINMYLNWEYTDSQVNTSAVTDYYTPFGALNKTIYTFIDVEPIGFNPKVVDSLPDLSSEDFDVNDVIGVNYFVGSSHTHYVYDETEGDFVSGVGRMLDVNSTTRSGVQQALTIPMQTHGSHAVVRFMTGDVNGETISTATQAHDMVFVVAGETDPIIATSFNTAQMIQYNTVQIPIVVYDPSKTSTTVILAEDGTTVSTWTGVDRTLHYWNYSPTTFGTKTLTISCGNTTKTIVIDVTQLEINEEEVIGYDFRFKASELATNAAVQQWSNSYMPFGSDTPKNVSMTFSENFDWVNGGLHTEYDEGNHLRQYFCVRAGTYVNINYDLFGQEYDPKQYGKNFKFIFKATNCRTYDAQVLSCNDTSNGNNGVGLTMTANEATFSTANNSIKTYYYKDSYIEFETNIHPDTEYPYLQFWMDGSHDVTKIYDSSDDIQQVNPVGITIGSPNCDVYIYMIKAYPTYLTNNNELSNFIMDAPNAYEMVDRYNRNDILNANGEIDYQKLATVNPDLHVLCLDLNRMSTGKKDNTVAYSVRHIYNRGGAAQCFTVNNACVTIQGTSSVGYLESAGNVDINFKYNRTFTSDNTSFTTGNVEFDDGTSSTSGFAMTANSIPVDYLNVKVNVASSENANNACIADWYNTYQPWLSPARAKKSKARDTMEFVPGVVFIRDRSGNLFYTEQQDTQTGQTIRIPDTQNYHMYGICDIGNSKKNTKVFHDTSNPIACCVEVSNNTSLPCLMSSKSYTWNADDEATIMEIDPKSGELKEQTVFEFRYSNDDTVDLAKNAWDRFVSFMYDYNPNLATNEPLDSPVTFGTYTFKGYGTYNTSEYDSEDYTVIYLYGYGNPSDFGYAATDYITDTTNEATCYYYINYSNNQIYASDGIAWESVGTLVKTQAQNNVLAGTSIGTYAGTYTHDTFNYRMAYMLEHCEEYMIIDPVVYHFIFIESFLMTDNVAKNTFWSCDDLVHWEPSKDYDNDTALGNDNVGGLSFTYGLETDDTVGSGYVFNAHDASWITFCRGIFEACQTMYRNRESAGCFNTANYLAKVKQYQDTRPERVWVADAQRKYLRPYEDNGTITYIPMLAGKKTHQREQTKTYNAYYYASKYVSDFCTSQNIMVRGNTPTTWTGVAPANTATLSMYINCYIVVASTSYNVVAKTKAVRGQSYVMDFTTIGSMGETELYFCTAPMITELSGLAHLYFKQNNFSMGTNLQRLEIGSNISGYENPNLENLTIGNNKMLEYLDVRNCPNATGALDLSGCLSLRELYLENTAFTGITFATGGLLQVAHLPMPTSLTMRELIYLQDLTIESTNSLNTLRIEDCIFAPTAELTIGETTTTQSTMDIVLNLVNSSQNLSRVRLIGMNWTLPGTTELNRLLSMAGIGDDSYNTPQSVLTGSAYINGAVRVRELDTYASVWEYLDVTYNPNNIVEQYAATYVNYDGTQLCQIYVDRGSAPPDPVATGVISAPTKQSDAQYSYTFDNWDDIESVMLQPRTITAQYSSTVRTYTVTWYSREGVPLRTTEAQYGSEVVYDGNIPTRTDGEASFRYYIFLGWDKSTGYITGNTDVYALWDEKELPSVGAKTLNDMSVAEIYGIANAQSINLSDYVKVKSYKDIQVGNDFNFTNVESDVLVENQWFGGNNHIDTQLSLFDPSFGDFTMAIDFEFCGTTSNATLVSCFEEEGNEGFRLRYSSGPNLQWGDKNGSVGIGTQRGICVIRHRANSDKLWVYAFNLNDYVYDDSITRYELTRSRSTTTNTILTFGAVKFPDGGYDFHATGWIHWCKIWYADLGDANARELVAWPHETWRAEYTGFENAYRLAIAGSSRYAKLSFVLNNLLSNGHVMNNSYYNTGGWASTSMNTFVNNRVYKALPIGYRSILQKVRVGSSAGDGSSEIVYADNYIYIPSLTEVSGRDSSPYSDECKGQLSLFLTERDRVKFLGEIVPADSTRFTSSEDPTATESNNVKAGDIWQYNSNYYIYIPSSISSKHRYSGSNMTAADGGLWYKSSEWWERSPIVDSQNGTFAYVSEYGYPYFNQWPATGYGIAVCFSV